MSALTAYWIGVAFGVIGSWAAIAVIVYTDPRRR